MTLILASHDNSHCDPSIANCVSAAKQCGGEIHILVVGHNCRTVAETCANLSSVDKVILVEHADCQSQLAENITQAVQQCLQKGSYTHVIADAGTTGKDVLPRLAAAMQVAPLSDVIEIHEPDCFSRPIYAGNAIEKVKNSAPLIVMSVRANRFAAVTVTQSAAPIESLNVSIKPLPIEWVSQTQPETERPDLKQARIVVSGGRGMQSKAQFQLLEELADSLHAAVGASRAAVDAGFVPNDYQVGQTGKTVAPELYLAFGISGAIQHVAGIKDSKVIVAVNQDADAPIFEIADYGLVADVFEVIPEIIAALKPSLKS